MLQRVQNDEVGSLEAMNAGQCFASLNQKRDCSMTYPTCVSSHMVLGWSMESCSWEQLRKYHLPSSLTLPVLVMRSLEQFFMLCVQICLLRLCCRLPAQVAAASCREFGARTGLPHHINPQLKWFLHLNSPQMAATS